MFLLHLQFDGQAVAIPARHIRRVKPRQRFRFDDDIFQHLVYRMAEMNVAVGIGWAVMQDEFRTAFGCGSNALVALLRLPLRQHQRLALGQIAAHGERGVGEIQRIFLFVFCHVFLETKFIQ